MRLTPIASSSSGNCIYVGTNNTHLLVDVGISGKKVDQGLNSLELTGNDIEGILITHEHIDHIGGLGVISRKYNIPIYATELTIEAIKTGGKIGAVEDDLFHIIEPDKPFKIKDMQIEAFKVFHDAADPVAYTFTDGKKKIAIATDTGKYNDYMVEHLRGANAYLLESNHDVRMLQMCSYPYQTKQRILSDHGHLSNETCGKLLVELLHDGIDYVSLGHLSKENNLPDLAFETVRCEIYLSECGYKPEDIDINVAKRDEISKGITI